jgi:hypothetical protein
MDSQATMMMVFSVFVFALSVSQTLFCKFEIVKKKARKGCASEILFSFARV